MSAKAEVLPVWVVAVILSTPRDVTPPSGSLHLVAVAGGSRDGAIGRAIEAARAAFPGWMVDNYGVIHVPSAEEIARLAGSAP